MTEFLDLADFLLIAEAFMGISAETLARVSRIDLAESALAAPRASFGGVEFYPDFVDKAAVLCSHIARRSSRRTPPRAADREDLSSDAEVDVRASRCARAHK